MERIIHIVFDPISAQALQQAFDIDPTLRDDILILEDDYTYGPVIVDTHNWDERKEWLKTAVYPEKNEQDIAALQEGTRRNQLTQRMNEDQNLYLWIWMTNHIREVCGYFSLLPWIKDFYSRVEIIFLHNLPFLNEKKQLFFPEALYQIPSAEYPKAKRLASTLSYEEMMADMELWQQLYQQNSLLRKIAGEKKCLSIDVESYDHLLLQSCSTEWNKISRVLQSVRQQKLPVPELFLLWRLRKLVDTRQLEIQGEWNTRSQIRLTSLANQTQTL